MNKRTLKATMSVAFLTSALVLNAGEPTVTTNVVETVKTKAGDVANFVTEKASQAKTAGNDYVVTPVSNGVAAGYNKAKAGASATGEYVSTKADQATFGAAAFVGNVKETVASKYASAKKTAGSYKNAAAKKANAFRGYVSTKAQVAKENAVVGFNKASTFVKDNPKKSAAATLAVVILGYVAYKCITTPTDEETEESADNAHNTFFSFLPFIG